MKLFGKEENNKIPGELKSMLSPQMLRRLKDVMSIPGQTFIVKKHLKYIPGRQKPDWVTLPVKQPPVEFEYPPTQSDIMATFSEYGGGAYQIWATKPMPQFVYTINISWMEPIEPFEEEFRAKKEREEEEDKVVRRRRKGKEDILSNILEADSLNPELKEKLIVAALAKELGLKPETLLLETERSHADPLQQAVADYVKKNPAILEKLAEKNIEKLLGLESDEVEKARKWRDFMMETTVPPDPFSQLLPMIAMIFPAMFGMGMGQQTQPQEELVEVRTKSGRVIYMPKSEYEKLIQQRRQKTREVREETKREIIQPTIPQELQQILNMKPQEVAAMIMSNKELEPYVENIVKNDMSLDGIIQMLSSTYPQYQPLIQQLVSQYRDWFEELLVAIKDLYRIRKGDENMLEELLLEGETSEEASKEETEAEDSEDSVNISNSDDTIKITEVEG